MTLHRNIAKTAAESALGEQFAALRTTDAERLAAFAAFEKSGLPTRRDEAWHYTDLRAAMASAPAPAAAPSADEIAEAKAALASRAKIGDVRFVSVNGYFVAELSDAPPPGMAIVAQEGARDVGVFDAASALNRAFAPAALSLHVAAGGESAPRVEFAHAVVGEGARAIYSRLHVTLEPGARLSVFEGFFGAGSQTQRNVATKLRLGARSRCDWAGLIDDAAALHLETQSAALDEEAEVRGFALVAGSALARRQLFVRHDGEGAKIALAGLSLIEGARHADTTLEVTHAAPRGESREYFRHIVADEASGVYQGKVIVKPHAQKTDGGMKSQAILLSPTAAMNNKPELEIFADDVVCGHGATVGALDAEQVFYLQARGVPRKEAEAMLLEAFGAEAIDRVEDEAAAEALREVMRAWLRRRA